MPVGHVMATNNTGADLAFGRCAMYRLASITNTEGTSTRADYDPRKCALSLVAADHINSIAAGNPVWGGMAITTEPIANNTMGRVAIAGLAFCTHDMTAVAPERRYIAPNPTLGFIAALWGFGRIIAQQSSTDNVFLVDLSDRLFSVHYQLTANMAPPATSSATATLGYPETGARLWNTTVFDPHAIAVFQKAGDKGWCEWNGRQWIVKIPFCGA